MSAGVALAVLGDPREYPRAPDLHRAGLVCLGLRGDSRALRTTVAELPARLGDLALGGYRGVNLTAPLKEAVLPLLSRVSEAARRARSVNTVGFEPDGWWGETTDGQGFLDLLATLGRDPAGMHAVFLGAGGAARSLALSLVEAGATRVSAIARDPDKRRTAWEEIPSSQVLDGGGAEAREARSAADLLVRAIPPDVEMGGVLPRHPGALCVDLAYGPEPTPWTLIARDAGFEAYDGLGLLVFQARLSLGLWFSRPVPVDPLTTAVGWPR